MTVETDKRELRKKQDQLKKDLALTRNQLAKLNALNKEARAKENRRRERLHAKKYQYLKNNGWELTNGYYKRFGFGWLEPRSLSDHTETFSKFVDRAYEDAYEAEILWNRDGGY